MRQDVDLDVQTDVHSEETFIVMRDGTRLATDIHLPARKGRPLPGPFPVLIERTPYDKRGVSVREKSVREPEPKARPRIARHFAAAGYAVVFQDCRGRFGSEGVFTKYLAEADDGVDTLDWIREQPWCDGRIGMFGMSYGAHTQLATACLKPPGLKAIILDSGGFANAFKGGIRRGGAFELKQATWAYTHALQGRAANRDPLVRNALEAENIADWFSAMPWKPGHSPLRWAPNYEDYLFDQWRRGTFDDYWRQIGLYAETSYTQFTDTAVLLMCGYYDPYIQSTVDNFTGLSAAGARATAMILGPWTHGERSAPFAGDVDFGPEATLDALIGDDYVGLRRAWFDCWVREDAAAPDQPRIRYFRMGGGSGRRNAEGRLEHGGIWRSSDIWPVAGAEETPFYCHGDGRLMASPPESDAESLTYDFDPARPVPTIGGSMTSGAPVFEAGAYDQVEGARFYGSRQPYLPLSARPDVLVFETPPLEAPVEVTGSITAHLWISTDAVDTDFTIKLIDVYPPSEDFPRGFAMNLTDGILRCRYRESSENPTMMTPHEVYRIKVDAFTTSNLFQTGHRIRVDISSSNFPHLDVNPNTGAAEGTGQHRRIAVNSIHVDRSHPSHIVLPVVAARETG